MKKTFVLLLLAYSTLAHSQKTTVKKTVTTTKTTSNKAVSGPEASIIAMNIEHNGGKQELNNKQFETWGGTTLAGGKKAVTLFYGASNSKKNDDSFSWMFTVPQLAIGTYKVGDHEEGEPVTLLMFSTALYPKIPQFLCKSGSIEITAAPAAGGFVTGTFQVVLTGGVTSDGVLDESEYVVKGSFSILRM